MTSSFLEGVVDVAKSSFHIYNFLEAGSERLTLPACFRKSWPAPSTLSRRVTHCRRHTSVVLLYIKRRLPLKTIHEMADSTAPGAPAVRPNRPLSEALLNEKVRRYRSPGSEKATDTDLSGTTA